MEVSIIISLRWHPLYLSTDIEGNVAVHVTKYGVSIYSNIFPHMYMYCHLGEVSSCFSFLSMQLLSRATRTWQEQWAICNTISHLYIPFNSVLLWWSPLSLVMYISLLTGHVAGRKWIFLHIYYYTQFILTPFLVNLLSKEPSVCISLPAGWAPGRSEYFCTQAVSMGL